MSYILEALRKSQQARDLGQVPRLQAPPWEEPAAVAGGQLGVWLALLLALLAAALALYATYATLQVGNAERRLAPATAAADPVATPLADPPALTAMAGDDAHSTPVAPAGSAAVAADDSTARAQGPSPEATNAALAGPALAPGLDLLLDDLPPAAPEQAPASATADATRRQPEVLVVPAPPAPGQRLARGAEELRRAVLGEPAPAPPPAPRAADGGPPRPVLDTAPVPPELLADIEAFKQQVGAGGGTSRPPPATSPAASAPATAATISPGGTTPPRASAELRRRLPAFSMSVHVYNADPARRFVYINGRKVGERELTREGLRLEQVLADGAVLSFGGETFFEPR